MPEEPQHDPNVPNPAEPWCPQCESHTDYAVSQVSAGESGSREKYTCKACGEAKFVHEMFILPTKKQISSIKAVGLWFPAICIPGIPLLFYFIGPDTEKAHSELIEAGGALSVLLFAVDSTWLVRNQSGGFETKKVARLGAETRLHGELIDLIASRGTTSHLRPHVARVGDDQRGSLISKNSAACSVVTSFR